MLQINQRSILLATFLACAGLLGAAYYFEYVMYLDPCPLCVMQRIAVLAVGLSALLGFVWHGSYVAKVVPWLLLLLSSILGLFVAGRHVWIQNLPADQVPTCGPSLDYMVDTLPWAEVISIMLRGNGNCAELSWSFLGLSMPAWVLLWFVGFSVLAIYFLYCNWKKKQPYKK